MMRAEKKTEWTIRLKAFLIWSLARIWLATLRLEVIGRGRVEKLRESGPLVYAFWHGSQFVLFKANPENKLAALTSMSRDGRMQAQIIERFGLQPVFGSSSRGGLSGLLALNRALRQGCSVAVAADGPRGPAREAKPGAVVLASTTGRPLIPVAVHARRKIVFGRAWDKFVLPWPFSRVSVCFGEPLQVQKTCNRDQYQAECEQLTRAINGLECWLTKRSELPADHGRWFFLYRLLWWLLLPLVVIYFQIRPKLRPGLRERLGGQLLGLPDPQTRVVWLHAASAGDVQALEPIAKAVKKRIPEVFFLLTTVTASGWSMAQKLKVFDRVRYAPFDIFPVHRRILKAFHPQVLVLQQAELWPEMIRSARCRAVKVVLVNGRLHPGKVSAYRRLFRLVGNLLRKIDILCMCAEEDLERAKLLGVDADRLRLTGNSKFDIGLQPPTAEELLALKTALAPHDEPIWLAGSTHRGEERTLLEAFSRLRPKHPQLRLVIAPRYLERVPEVIQLSRSFGFTVGRRSQSEVGQVVVLDTMGELRTACYIAQVVFVGGSLVKRGGHNLLEPVFAARPVLYGPHQENFPEIARMLRGRGGFEVSGPEEMAEVVDSLISDPQKARSWGKMANETVLACRGASEMCAREIVGLLEGRDGGA